MIKECKNCTYFKNNICIKNSKNGYNNCKKYKSMTMNDMMAERKILLVSASDSDRLDYLTKRIMEINGGTY